MKTFLSIVVLLCFAFNPAFTNSADLFNGGEPTHITTVAKSGDGVYSLLRKYHLNPSSCNLNEFYKLNSLGKDAQLKIGKSYKLPIKVYTYNGTSIRSTIGLNDWDIASSIKEYNDKLVELKVHSKSYVSSKVLWVPFSLVNCNSDEAAKDLVINNTAAKTSTKAEKGKYIIEPLFGKEHERFPLLDNSLKGKVYYLVSGHGGPDPGASSGKMYEDEYAYDIALRLARNLMSHGATVHVVIQDANDGIRSGQYFKADHDEKSLGKFKIPYNQLRRLEQRSKHINELYKKHKREGVKEQYAIMLHIDSRSEDKRVDAFFYYYKHGKTSKALADHMQSTFKDQYNKHQKGRGYKGFVATRNLYMVNHTLPTALFVELGNIKNKNDQKRFLYHENRQALADWLYDGVSTFKK